KRQQMEFRDPLRMYLAKFKLPFSSGRRRRLRTLSELRDLGENFWERLAARPDVHIEYTPEFVAWRFFDRPRTDYIGSAVEGRGEVLGLCVTRRFKGPFDLLVDFAGREGALRA